MAGGERLFRAAHLARDLEEGLLLIEDFGSVRMRETVDADVSLEREIYSGITDVLVELHRHTPPAGLNTHGLAQWLDEVGLFTEWYGPAVGLDLDAVSFRAAWEVVLAPIDAQGQSVAELRDFHAENVMLARGSRASPASACSTFRTHLVGHSAYDLVSMLEDARRDATPAAWRRRCSRATSRRPSLRRDLKRLIGRSARSATHGFRAYSSAFGSATASRTIASFSPACGGCWSAIWRIR